VVGDSIWGAAERFASGGAIRDFCVVAGPDPLYCQSGQTLTADAFLASGDASPSGTVMARSPEGDLIIGHAELFLEAAFAAPPIRVLVTEAVSDLYGTDLALFRYSFGVALALGLLMVVLLATIQVRRTMTPLDALTEGTVRLAEGDLSTRVSVTSGDEFELLAASFNSMAQRLGVQFQTLEAGRAIDRAVLSAMDVHGVVDALLGRFKATVPCRSLAILVLKRGTPYRASLFWRARDEESRSEANVTLSPFDLDWLDEPPHHRVVEALAQRPPFLVDAFEALGPSPLVALAMKSQQQLLGAVVFEVLDDRAPDAEVIQRGRQVADQATVALDAVGMVEDLEEMYWGALRALARAIDAKSQWTAGHSERVTALALQLGRALGLSAADLDTLHRGGLLHDIGKIGVPARLLDTPGKLSKEDWDLVRQHPEIGGRILEPIRAFAPALPIVRQHHERWDGKGYPFGLAGVQIHPLARVLTVADTYDAMASSRPYRAALDTGAALAEIRRGRGTQFEPRIVDVFLEMMAQRDSVPAALGRTDG
jgi:putative nucleotidyltransferase with HDIG domain